jgi:perosamine synthetase
VTSSPLDRRIALFKPVLAEEAIEAVEEVLRSGWLGLGPRTAEFEADFRSYVGSSHCVALNSGTSALHLALRLLNLGEGDEVVTTALTFVSTNHTILYERATPVFADVFPDTGNLDPVSIEASINERTRALIVVHYGGQPCDLEEIYEIARRYEIVVIEDCAHACGATYRGEKIGSHGDFHAFSFHAVKNLPMGDGGALTLASAEHDKRARRLRWLGIDRSTYDRSVPGTYAWDYDVPEVGFKYHMNDISAAIGLAQLRYLDAENGRRSEIASVYRQRLEKVPGVSLLREGDDRTSSNHFFSILVENRDQLVDKLKKAGIDTGVHYRRNDLYQTYESANLPNTEFFWTREISLPMHLALSDEDVRYITDVIETGW